MTSKLIDLLYLGNRPTMINTDFTNWATEHGSALLGTYGTPEKPLWYFSKNQGEADDLVNDLDSDGIIRAYNPSGTHDQINNIDVSGIAAYNLKITYEDGSTVTSSAAFAQLANGDIYLTQGDATSIDDGTISSTSIFEKQPIVSIELTQLRNPITNDPEVYSTGGTQYRFFSGVDRSQGTIPVCFTDGMMIETNLGEVAVENLKIGMLVRTYDHGMKPIRFIHKSSTRSVGENSPVVFEKHSIGNDRPFIVSQKHRIYTGTIEPLLLPTLLRDCKDNLIHAYRLVNGTTIRFKSDARPVNYYHILLDEHELIYCHGVISESWHPVRRILQKAGDDKETRREMKRLFPELKHKTVSNTPLVRPMVPQLKLGIIQR